MIRSVPKKRPIIAIVEKSKGAKGSSSRKMPYKKPDVSHPSTFSLRSKEAAALLEQRIKDNVIHLPQVEFAASLEDVKDLKGCPFHRKKGDSRSTFAKILTRNISRRSKKACQHQQSSISEA